MWVLWSHVRGMIERTGNSLQHLSDAEVLKGIIHHDLNKVHKYKLVSTEPWEVDYAKDVDILTEHLGDTHKSLHLLGMYNISVPLKLHGALVRAEGGFSETKTKAESVFAKVLYILDELSANVISRIDSGRLMNSKREAMNVEI
jgi:hypothetical protein